MNKYKYILILFVFLIQCCGCISDNSGFSTEVVEATKIPVSSLNSTPTSYPSPTSTVEEFQLPKGKLIFHANVEGIIWYIDFPSLEKKMLYEETEYLILDPQFFPDGEKIAFLWGKGKSGTMEIYMGDIYGSEPVRLTDNDYTEHSIDISTNGNEIVFVREVKVDNVPTFDLYILDLVTKSIDRLTYDGEPKYEIKWSPDGGKISYISGDLHGDLGVINHDGTEQRRILQDNVKNYADLSWSADNKMIAVPIFTTEKIIEIAAINVDTGETIYVTDRRELCFYPSFSLTNDDVLFVCKKEETMNIFVLDLNTKNITQLSNFQELDGKSSVFPPLWVSESSEFLFSLWIESETSKTFEYNLFLMSTETKSLFQITDGLNIPFYDWSSE